MPEAPPPEATPPEAPLPEATPSAAGATATTTGAAAARAGGETGAGSRTTGAPPPAIPLDEVGIIDADRLRRRRDRVRQFRDPRRRASAVAEFEAQLRRARERLSARRGVVPTIQFPPQLPVADRISDLSSAIEGNQVVIVAGETGSGKSTQLPKLCLQLGRGVRGMIGHTQPRRIAARALAERIAEETGTAVGGAVGYAVRFGDHTGPNTLVKLMTDGILLAEIHHDRDLLRYDTIIIDEAHERSLNIDFLLGYLTELLPRRPDLKLVITSATIDPDRFSRHFGGAPVVEVSGRTYPVEIRYRPYGVDAEQDETEDEIDDGPELRDSRRGGPRDATGAGRDGRRSTGSPAARAAGRDRRSESGSTADQSQAICRAVDELSAAGDGDILVFLSGEREIIDTAEVLRGHLQYRPGSTEVLPLFGRLSAADQHRVFSAHTGRRIVLSTNVAETSLTVPGIRYVVDPGTARISRYSTRSKVQRLPIEKISQASAGQRAGRCGRVADGICIRLYSADDFAGRPEFTEPEIARTSLASVILQMAAMELGGISTFPFVDPPDSRQISDGITVLTELGALQRSSDGGHALTQTGRAVAALPIDPRLARMIVEGERRGCLDEMLVIAAALAIQDVREYPLDDRDRATAAHSRFVDPTSDFVGVLSLWRYLRAEARTRSGNSFRRLCRAEYLHYLRVREWQDLHAQLRQVTRDLKLGHRPDHSDHSDHSERTGQSGRPDAPTAHATQQGRGALAVTDVDTVAVHTAALSGLLSHVGVRSEAGREYQGTRGTSFLIWPGSALAKSPPHLAVAAELVETSRLWARTVAAVQPEWVEHVGGDLLRRSYSEPRWDRRRAAVMATEKVMLLGVTLIPARSVQFDRIDPGSARELFLRHALVEGDWDTRHAFFRANRQTADEVAALEDRVRRRNILVDDEVLFALYDARIPADVTSGRHFDAWWRKESRAHPDLLTFTADQLTAPGVDDLDQSAYPDSYRAGGVDLDLDYVYDPGRADDGVRVTIPLPVLARVDPAAFQRQIPGLRSDLVTALLRSLPKTLRRNFVPAADFASAALTRMPAESRSVPAELAAALTAMTGIRVGAEDFDLAKVPPHLRMTFRVVDADGREVGAGKDLPALQRELRAETVEAVAQASGTVRHRGLRAFPAEGVERTVTSTIGDHEVVGYPALVDEGGGTVGVSVFTAEADQARAQRAGVRRLLAFRLPPPTGHVRNGLTRSEQLTLASSPYGTLTELLADATEAAIDALLDWAGGPAWTGADFEKLVARLQPALPRAVLDVLRAVQAVLVAANRAAAAIEAAATSAGGAAAAPSLVDMRAQLADLVRPGFATASGSRHLPDAARYLEALAMRAGRLRENPARDLQRTAELRSLTGEVVAAAAALPPERRADSDVAALYRLLQEYRVAVFAQPMRTAVPVSAKRILAAIGDLSG